MFTNTHFLHRHRCPYDNVLTIRWITAQPSRFSGNDGRHRLRKSGRSIGRVRRLLARAARGAVARVNKGSFSVRSPWRRRSILRRFGREQPACGVRLACDPNSVELPIYTRVCTYDNGTCVRLFSLLPRRGCDPPRRKFCQPRIVLFCSFPRAPSAIETSYLHE